MAAGVGPPCFLSSSRSTEPLFTPMRMGTPAARAACTTRSTLSGPPMLPGLIRRPLMPASTACTARRESKWMSAMRGTAASAQILFSATDASRSSTATRTISQPARARASIWARVASASRVSVLVMDWTRTGLSPPMPTPPTDRERVLERGARGEA
jgi:hypothetical protein